MRIRSLEICYRTVVVAKADTWIKFPVDPADFKVAKDDWQINLHFYVQLEHLNAHMCKFSNLESTEMNISVVKEFILRGGRKYELLEYYFMYCNQLKLGNKIKVSLFSHR